MFGFVCQIKLLVLKKVKRRSMKEDTRDSLRGFLTDFQTQVRCRSLIDMLEGVGSGQVTWGFIAPEGVEDESWYVIENIKSLSATQQRLSASWVSSSGNKKWWYSKRLMKCFLPLWIKNYKHGVLKVFLLRPINKQFIMWGESQADGDGWQRGCWQMSRRLMISLQRSKPEQKTICVNCSIKSANNILLLTFPSRVIQGLTFFPL